MNPIIETWNSLSIQDTHFKAFIPPGSHTNLSAQSVYAPRVGDFPYLSMAQWGSQIFPIKIRLLDRGSTLLAQRNILKGYFGDMQPHKLVVYDQDNSNRAWYLTGIAISIVEEEYAILTVNLALADPIWRVVSTNAANWSITASGDTVALSVIGNYPAKMVFAYMPTGTRTSGFVYKRWMPVYNPISTPFTNKPFNIVGTTLNTAALVTANKMLADGSDTQLWVDGVPVSIWFLGFNTTATKIWFNGNWSATANVTTGASIAGSGAVTSIQIHSGVTNFARSKVLANAYNKIVMIDSEAFSYTGVSMTTRTKATYLTGVTRAQKGTSMGAHSAGAAVHWIEHDIWLEYDWSGITSPDICVADDTTKPIISLDSTNTSWIWTTFRSLANNQTGEWLPSLIASLTPKPTPDASTSQHTTIYSDTQIAFVDPSVEMGMSIEAFKHQNVWQPETASLQWSVYHPAGFTNLLYLGKKFAYSTTWPASAVFQTSVDGISWTNNLAEAIPTANTWTAFGPRNQAIAVNSPHLRFLFAGSVPGSQLGTDATNGYIAAIQFDTVTATIASANIPQVTPGAEIAAYHANFTLTNNNTGESITVNYPHGMLNHIITIDCINKRCFYDDGANIPVVLSSLRNDWLNLVGGVKNTLLITDEGMGTGIVLITWSDCQI